MDDLDQLSDDELHQRLQQALAPAPTVPLDKLPKKDDDLDKYSDEELQSFLNTHRAVQQAHLGAARQEMEEAHPTTSRIGQALPFYDVARGARAHYAQKAIDDFTAGPDDYRAIAHYQLEQERRQEDEQGFVGKLRAATLGLPGQAAQLLVGGKVARAAVGAVLPEPVAAGAGILPAVGRTTASAAATAALTPNLGPEQWVQHNLQNKRDPFDLRGAPPAFGIAFAQMVALDGIGKLTGKIAPNAGPFAQMGVQAGTGPLAQQAIDLGSHFLGLQTRYGALEDFREGKYGEGAAKVIGDALTFATFHALHGEPEKGKELLGDVAKSLNDAAKKGVPASKAAEQAAKLLAASNVPEPQPAQPSQPDRPQAAPGSTQPSAAREAAQASPQPGPEAAAQAPGMPPVGATVEYQTGFPPRTVRGTVTQHSTDPTTGQQVPWVQVGGGKPQPVAEAILGRIVKQAPLGPFEHLSSDDVVSLAKTLGVKAKTPEALADALMKKGMSRSGVAALSDSSKPAQPEQAGVLETPGEPEQPGPVLAAAPGAVQPLTPALAETFEDYRKTGGSGVQPAPGVSEPGTFSGAHAEFIAEMARNGDLGGRPDIPRQRAEEVAARSGRNVALEDVFESAGLSAKERHVVRERMLARSHEDIAADEPMKKKDGSQYSRQRVKQLEQRAMEKLGLVGQGLPEGFSLADLHEGERIDRALDLMEKGGRVSPAELSGQFDPESGKLLARKAKARMSAADEADARADKLVEEYIKEAENNGGRVSAERQRHWDERFRRVRAGLPEEAPGQEGQPASRAQAPAQRGPVEPTPVRREPGPGVQGGATPAAAAAEAPVNGPPAPAHPGGEAPAAGDAQATGHVVEPGAYKKYTEAIAQGRNGKIGTVGDFLKGNPKAEAALSREAKDTPVYLGLSRGGPVAIHDLRRGKSEITLNTTKPLSEEAVAFTLAHEAAHVMRVAAGRGQEYQAGVENIAHDFEQSANRLGEHVSGMASEDMAAQVAANRDRPLAAVSPFHRAWEQQAVAAGHDPAELHPLAKEYLDRGKAQFDPQRNQTIDQAWAALKEHGTTPQKLRAVIKKGGDPADMPGMDEVAQGLGLGDDQTHADDALAQLLMEGKRQPLKPTDAYQHALDELNDRREAARATEEARRSGFSAKAAEEALRSGQEDGEAEGAGGPGDAAGGDVDDAFGGSGDFAFGANAGDGPHRDANGRPFGMGAAAAGELIPPQAEQRTQPTTTALANKKIDSERLAEGMNPIIGSARMENPEAWDAAQHVLDQDPKAGEKLIESLVNKPRATNVIEQAILLREKIRLDNEYRVLGKQLAEADGDLLDVQGLQDRVDELGRQRYDLALAVKRTGTELGRSLQFRKQLAAEDYSLQGMLQEFRTAAGREATPEEAAKLASLQKQIEDLQGKLEAAEKAYTGAGSKPSSGEAEGMRKAMARLLDAKGDVQRTFKQARDARRPPGQKVADWLVKLRVNEVISSPVTLAKIVAASAERVAIGPLEEAAGAVWSRIPGIAKIAAMAPREGRGLNPVAEKQAIGSAFTQGIADSLRTLKTGRSELDVLHGKTETPRGWLDLQFSLHDAAKAPAVRAEFTRSFLKRVDAAAKAGQDATSPAALLRFSAEAYKDSQSAKFRQENWLVDAYTQALAHMEKTGNPFAKATATGARLLLPVVRVPTNLAFETLNYAFGAPVGAVRALNAIARGVENVPVKNREAVMQQLKKGSLGAAAMLVGYFNPQTFGGYYSGKRKDEEVKAGAVRVGGVNVPAWLQHNPLLQVFQMGATMRRAADTFKGGEKQGLGVGIGAGLAGTAEEIPFVRETKQVAGLSSNNATERGHFFGELLKSLALPQAVQWLAGETDKKVPFSPAEEPVHRKPKGVLQTVESGFPGLRQKVPAGR